MKLLQYLEQTQTTIPDLAEKIGDVTVSGVRKWLNGERVPRPDQMRKIYEVTNGLVSPNDFYLEATP